MVPASLRIPAFRRLLGAMTLSALGSMMTFIVLPLVAWHETGSTSTFAFILAAGALGMLVAMPFGGVITDRFDRRRVMLVGQVLQLVVITSMLLAVRAELWWLLPAVELLQTTLGSLTSSAGPALRRDVLTDDVRTEGTALQTAAMSGVQLFAPLLGGALYGVVGFTMVMMIDLACVALALVLVLGLRLDPSVTRPTSAGAGATGSPLRRAGADIADGLRIARRDPFLRLDLLGMATSGISNGIVLVAMVVWFEQHLGLPAEMWGASLAIMGTSGLVASLVIARIGERVESWRLMVLGTVPFVGGALLLLGHPGIPRIVVAFVLVGFTNVMLSIASATIVQRRVASSHQGRINSLMMCSAQATQLVASLGAGLFLDAIGSGPAMQVAVAVLCTTATIYAAAGFAARTPTRAFTEDELALSA